MSKSIYLDHAATTPVDPEVFKAMEPYFSDKYGNASSIHSFGQEATRAIDKARDSVSKYLNCNPEEIIFTSGATESNNLAIKGIVESSSLKKPHIITSKIEHHCVLETVQYLERKGKIEATYLETGKDGVLNTKLVQNSIKENTLLVSIMYANNEIGTIQPIKEIGNLLKNINLNRKNKIYFHTDAVQAIGYLNCDVQRLEVDLLSLSAHKFYGPKGIGILFVKKGTKISPLHHGGAHEFGLRSGTLNVPLIVGLGKAIELLQTKKYKQDVEKIKKLRDKLISEVLKNIPKTTLNGSRENRVPGNANFRFKNIEGESIMLGLDFEGIYASTGSACASGSLKPSHVLLALGIPQEEAHGSLRITLGKENTEKDIDKLLEILPKVIKNLRKISPLK
jgi:cysteine desulfurase